VEGKNIVEAEKNINNHKVSAGKIGVEVTAERNEVEGSNVKEMYVDVECWI
jgi:hypothetical protein